MAQGLDRIKSGGLVCWEEPEHHADHPEKTKAMKAIID